MKTSTGALCGIVIFAFGLVLPAWLLFFAAGGSFAPHPETAPMAWALSFAMILVGGGIGAVVAEEGL